MKRVQACVIYSGRIVGCTIVPDSDTDQQIKEKLMKESAIMCDRPHETPVERDQKIRWGYVKRYPHK